METRLLSEINTLLKEFPEYWAEEYLIKHKVIDDLREYRMELIEALLSNETVFNAYGIKTSKGVIIKIEDLISMLRYKSYWDNSYTKYSTKIGLSGDGKYLNYSSDVVLDFPYKDCVFEGGMTSEDLGKKEVYYHKILAKDEIDLLFSEKVLTNVKRFSEDGVEEITSFKDNDNLILKGNNLIALHTLKKRFSGEVKLIYIDPPFNTGGDGFKYNDRFNHSTWLTFMKNRLEVARDLLSEDGTIYIHLDYNEVHYCKVLMDEIFGRKNFLNEIVWGYKERETSKRFYNKKHDTILFYAKNASSNYTFNFDEVREKYSEITISKFKYTDENGERYRLRTRDGRSDPAEEDENTYRQYLDDKSGPLPRDWFVMPFLNQSSNERIGFNTQKPELLLEKFIKASSNENDIVLDFFSGSATTLATAHKLKRRYIGIEQMNYINEISIPRLQEVIKGVQNGISQKNNWQGGGSFVYAELLESNQHFSNLIGKSENKDSLIELMREISDHAHFDYKIKLENVLENETFKELSLEEQKRIILESLDVNMMYLPYSEIEDLQYGISDEVKAFNYSFYSSTDRAGEDE